MKTGWICQLSYHCDSEAVPKLSPSKSGLMKKKKKRKKKKRNLTTSTSHFFSHCMRCSLRFFLPLQLEKREKLPFYSGRFSLLLASRCSFKILLQYPWKLQRLAYTKSQILQPCDPGLRPGSHGCKNFASALQRPLPLQLKILQRGHTHFFIEAPPARCSKFGKRTLRDVHLAVLSLIAGPAHTVGSIGSGPDQLFRFFFFFFFFVFRG